MALVQRDDPGASGAHSSERDDEPVFGLPRREVEGWLAENPTYEPSYKAELAAHRISQAGLRSEALMTLTLTWEGASHWSTVATMRL